jgi:hypothetical protein
MAPAAAAYGSATVVPKEASVARAKDNREFRLITSIASRAEENRSHPSRWKTESARKENDKKVGDERK